VRPSPCIKLAPVQVGLATVARHPQDRQRPQRIEVRENERRLKISGGIISCKIVPERGMLPSVSTVR
jgi:hypothetical protein